MASQELYIKNMVCSRCVFVVRGEWERLGYSVMQVELGRATIDSPDTDLTIIGPALEQHGFALLTDKTTRVVNQVKTLIIDLIRSGHIAGLKTTLSDYLASQVGLDYAHLSHLGYSSVAYLTKQFKNITGLTPAAYRGQNATDRNSLDWI